MKTMTKSAFWALEALWFITSPAIATQWEFGIRVVRNNQAAALPVYLYHQGSLNVPIRVGESLGYFGDGVNFRCDVADPGFPDEPDCGNAQMGYIKPGEYALRISDMYVLVEILPFQSGENSRDFSILSTENGFSILTGDRVVLGDASTWESTTTSSVTLDQKSSLNETVGKLYHVFPDGFDIWTDSTNETIPVDQNSTVTLRADRSVLNGEKYENWNSLSDVRNHHVFQVNDVSVSLSSHFAPIVTGTTITAEFVDLPSVIPDSILFKDPWFVDMVDVNYGGLLRNQGMDAPFRVRSCPFSPDLSTIYDSASPYQGVLLDQQFQDGVYYSSGVPLTKYLGDTLFYFLNWSGDAQSVSFQNAVACTTGIVFDPPPSVVPMSE